MSEPVVWAGRTFGQLTPDEQHRASRESAGQLQVELSHPRMAAAILGRGRCDANSRKGTGTGVCDAPLDAHGQCPRADEHVDDRLRVW